MANQEHLDIFRQGKEVWNTWPTYDFSKWQDEAEYQHQFQRLVQDILKSDRL